MIKLVNVNKFFGSNHVLKDVNLHVHEGEKLVIIGPSGSGKSTTVRCMNFLEEPTSGQVFINGEELTHKNKTRIVRSSTSMVFQQFNLYPHKSVLQNLTLAPMKLQGKSREEAEDLAFKYLDVVGLRNKANVYPSTLSGGQQQRVALARALVLEPGVLLFDEPLSNLDAKLRVSMRTEIRRIQQATGITAIYVTHDQSEAMALSDSIIIMNKGVVAQIGSPQEIYYHPNSEFVADFIGEANFLKGKCVALEDGCGVLQLADTQVRVAATENMAVGEDYTIVLRPESAGLVPEGNLKCRVVLSCFMGAYQNYHVMVGDTLVKLTDYNPKNHRIYQVGETCALTFEPDGVHVL